MNKDLLMKTADEVLAALKSREYIGIVAYRGPSKLDGAPIIAVFNRIADNSNNAKTGAMVQSFFLREDIAPHDALKTGQDASVCGNCAFRPINGGKTRCYVKVFQAPLSVWKAYHNGRYLIAGVDFPLVLLPEIFAGLNVRFGSYGDPMSVPVKIIRAIASKAANHTGYSHQWRSRDARHYKPYLMASADNLADHESAVAKGWRTFRVRKSYEQKSALEFICPASKEAGVKTNCAKCGLCAGASITAKNPVIIDHGLTRERV